MNYTHGEWMGCMVLYVKEEGKAERNRRDGGTLACTFVAQKMVHVVLKDGRVPIHALVGCELC